jgi:hypothetical protein
VDADDHSQEPRPERRWEDGEASFPSGHFPSGLAFRAPGALCGGTGPLFMGKYRVLTQLGRGGMGVVFAAEHIHSGATVAIKMLPAKDEALGDRLLRESRALARLGHPNIVQLFDSGITDEGDYYIIMELVPGVTFRALMQRALKTDRPLALRLVLTVVFQMTVATASAHGVGIVHRDIKPENMMVAKRGRAKLLDFGLAKDSAAVAPGDALGAASNPAHVTGTPRYMAPEQVKGGEIDGRTDIYAIGIVLYEAVCGHTPYGDDPTTATDIVMGHHLFATPHPIHDSAPDCPDDVCVIIMRCLEKSPAQRYGSAEELAKALGAALERCVAHARAVRAMGRVVRVTEPMPEVREERPVLPFPGADAKPLGPPVVAPVISQMMPPEDEEVTLKRGTMLPAPADPAPPVAAAPAPSPVSDPAPPAVQASQVFRPPPARLAAPALVSCGAAPARPAAPVPPGAVASAPPAPPAPGAAPTASGSTANGGLAVEAAALRAPGQVKPPADATPVALGKRLMKAPPYYVGAVGGVALAVVLVLISMVGAKKGDAHEPSASNPLALSESTAPSPPSLETAASAPPPVETAAPAPPPTETAAPAPEPAASAPRSPPPPIKPPTVRPVTPAPTGTPVQPQPAKELVVRKPTPAATPSAAAPPAPPPSPPQPPPAETKPEPARRRIFGSEQ